MVKLFSIALVACLSVVGCSMDTGSDEGSQSPDEQGSSENMTKGEENVGKAEQALCGGLNAFCTMSSPASTCCLNYHCVFNKVTRKGACAAN